MNKKLFLIFVIMVLCSFVFVTAQTTEVEKTSRYKNTDGTLDIINGYTTMSHTKWDIYAQFHGQGYLKAKPLPFATGATTKNISTTMWIQSDTVNERQELLCKSDYGMTYGDNGNSWGYTQYINDSGYLCAIMQFNSTSFYAECATDNTIDDNAQHSLVVYYNMSVSGGDITFFIDGVEQNDSSFNSNMNWAGFTGGFNTDVHLGACQDGTGYRNAYKGKMDDVVIYYIELDATDATSYHGFGMGAGTPISFFRMNNWDFELKKGEDNWDDTELSTIGLVTYDPYTKKNSITQDTWSLLQFDYDDNSTAYDSVSVNNGTYYGNAYATVNPYNTDFGDSLVLDGTSGTYVQIDRQMNFSRNNFSFGSSFSVEGTITDRQPLALATDGLGNYAFMVDVINEKIEVSLFDTSNTRTRFYTTTNVTANAMHRVDVYYNQTHLSIFLDGNLENYTNHTSQLNDELLDVYYGFGLDSGVFWFDGIIDEVYLMNVETTPNFHFGITGESNTRHNTEVNSTYRDVTLNTTLNFMNLTLTDYLLPLNTTLEVYYRLWNVSQGYLDSQSWDLSWLHFDGDATDDGQLGTTANLIGGATPTVSGKFNQALYCDGIDDAVTLDYSYTTQVGSFILYVTPLSNDEGTIVSWGENLTARINSAGYYTFNITNAFGSFVATSDTQIEVNRTDHLVFNWGDNYGIRIYLNGKETARVNGYSIPNYVSGQTAALCQDSTGSDFLNVEIDEFVAKATTSNENTVHQFLTGTYINYTSWSNAQNFDGTPLLFAQNDSENIQFRVELTSNGNGGSSYYTPSFKNLRVGQYINDTQAPTIADLTESPSDPLTYDPTLNLTFTANVTDDYNLTLVNFTINGSTYIPTQSGNIFTVVIPILTVGVHNYMWSAQDETGNIATQNTTYTINQDALYLLLSILPSSNITETTESNVTGLQCPDQLTCNLYRDGVLVSNSDIATLNAGTYVYIFNTTGNANYSSDSVTGNLTVTPPDLSVYPVCNIIDEVNEVGDLPCVQMIQTTTDCSNITATVYNNQNEIVATQQTQQQGLFCGFLFAQETVGQYIVAYDTINQTQDFDVVVQTQSLMSNIMLGAILGSMVILAGILFLVGFAIKFEEVPKGRILEKSIMYAFALAIVGVVSFLMTVVVNSYAELDYLSTWVTSFFVLTLIVIFAIVSSYLFYILTTVMDEGTK